MHFPKYWARGAVSDKQPDSIVAWAWSDVSREDALQKGNAKAARILAALHADRENQLDRYAYWVRGPMREEVIREVGHSDADRAVVSRNRYGSLVLNTANVMFIDVDDASGPPKPPGLFAALFGRRKPVPATPQPLWWEAQRRQIEAIIAEESALRIALYRTCAGFRLLVLNRLVDPASRECARLFTRFMADPLYIRLTHSQKCYRARLTPKHWRCMVDAPPYEYPFMTSGAERDYRNWEARYTQGTSTWGTCEHLGDYGPAAEIPEAAFIRQLHDTFTLNPGRPLA